MSKNQTNIPTFGAVIYSLWVEYAIKRCGIGILLVVLIAVSRIVCYAFPDYFDVRATYTQTWGG